MFRDVPVCSEMFHVPGLIDDPFFKPHGKNQINVFLSRLFLFIFPFLSRCIFLRDLLVLVFFSLSPHLFTLCAIKIREMRASQSLSNKGLLRFTHGGHTQLHTQLKQLWNLSLKKKFRPERDLTSAIPVQCSTDWLDSSVGRALHRYHGRGHGFESRSGLNFFFFRLKFHNCLSCVCNCDDQS